jgi:hypothetical protein
MVQGILSRCLQHVGSGLEKWMVAKTLKVVGSVFQKHRSEIPRASGRVLPKEFEYELTSIIGVSRSLLRCWGLRLKAFPTTLLISLHGRDSSSVG